MLRLTGVLAALLAFAGLARAEPMPPHTMPVPVATATTGTPAAETFCFRHPAECRVDRDEPALIPLTRDAWDLIVRVDRQVNARIEQVSDLDHFGVLDRWDFPVDGKGDCEDIQLEKRRLLRLAGLPQRAMRMAVVTTSRGEGHAVLVVRTDAGDLVLDNLTDDVLPWNETGYRFIKRESSDEWGWVMLVPEQAGPPLTARAAER